MADGLYAAGLTVRDIRAHFEDVYGLQVSPDLISRVTDAELDEVREWQSRALERMYPIAIFDALRVKIRDADSRMVKNKAVYVALGVSRDGVREVLGLWIADNEGAKFWLSVMNKLKYRGVQDILIAVVDGLKGFPDAITVVFPEATVQTCIVDPVLCLRSGNTQDHLHHECHREPEPRDLKSIKTRGSFPTEEAATKLIYLAIRNFEKGGRNVREWFAARNQFAILFDERFNAGPYLKPAWA